MSTTTETVNPFLNIAKSLFSVLSSEQKVQKANEFLETKVLNFTEVLDLFDGDEDGKRKFKTSSLSNNEVRSSVIDDLKALTSNYIMEIIKHLQVEDIDASK